jgi:hypothetical protein
MNSRPNTLLVAGLIDDRIQDAAKDRLIRELKHQSRKSAPKSWRWFSRPGFARTLRA